jgi:hypothetical protein
MPNEPAPSWRTGVARRLQRLAGALADDAEDRDAPVADAAAAGSAGVNVDVEALDGETAEELAARRLRAVIEELYPTVAARVLALALPGTGAEVDVDEWVTVARLLYDAHMHRVGGPSIEARQQALVATLGKAIEAQARSSARLAGFTEDELDRPSGIEGDAPGTLLWEHYLCPPARLARSALHGEAVGDWLGALGELWSATDALYELVTTTMPELGTTETDDDAASSDATLERVKVALVRVQELSLW